MKKTKLIIISLVLIVVAVIATLLILSFNGIIGAGTFSEKTYTCTSAEIENINIDVRDRKIEIQSSSDDQIHINYFESEKEKIDISISNKRLNVQFVDEKSWIDRIGMKADKEYREISIEIPNNLLSNLTINTTNENIELTKISIKSNLTLESNGGDIRLNSVQVGSTIDLKTKNGSIVGTIVGDIADYSIDCTIKKGNSNLPAEKLDGIKHLIADCNNGDINISFI